MAGWWHVCVGSIPECCRFLPNSFHKSPFIQICTFFLLNTHKKNTHEWKANTRIFAFRLFLREYLNVPFVTCRDRTGDFVVVMHLLSSIWQNSIGLKNRKTRNVSIFDRTKAPSGERFTTKVETLQSRLFSHEKLLQDKTANLSQGFKLKN